MDFEREWNVDAAADRQQAPEPELAALAARVKGDPIQPGSMRTVTPGADGVVVLPAGTDINQIEVDGRNLVVTLPDGTQMVILDGAVVVPRIVVGDVEIPSVNLAALLIGEEPQPAAGPARSSGGNFLAADGKLGDPYALGDLLPPTELSFTQPEEREILPFAPTQDDEPEVQIVTPDQPAGATSATAVVSEAGLSARGEEPAGSAATGDSERTTGAIVFSANDGPSVVAIGGVAVTAVGQTFTTPLGVLTITSIEAGSIGYSYTLSDNVVGVPPAEVFTVTVTDADGDQATATLTISITDDGPNAIDDVDSVTEDGPLVADGNVLTGVGGSDANGTDGVADVEGADGIASVTTGTFEGTYGTLILSAGGGYRYELANGNPAVQFLTPGQTLTDSFSYTITDADGSTSSATLTITINGADDGVTIIGLTDGPGANGAELVVLENDLADGSSPDAPALTQGGSFSVSGPDGLTSVTVGGVTVLANGAFVAGQVVTTPLGTMTITGFTATSEQGGVPTAGSFTYSFVLTDNSLNHGAAGADNLFESFAVVATDRNGSTAAGAIDVQIVDDLPTARGDVDGVAAGTYGPERGNVISGAGTVSGAAGADTRGADGAAVAGVSAGAGGAALVNAETVGQVIQGAYGKLTLNGDGSYSYVRDAGTPGGVSDSFTYTLRDGDGDLSTATLRIDIANSEVMIISIPRIGEGTVVDEAGLDAGVGPAPGSNAGADVETTSGVITYSAPDGPSTVTINDIPVTGAGQRIETDKGYLEIISISEGRIEYSYTLTGNTDNSGDEPVTDSFEVTVTDVDGDRATDTLVITILDDHPTAVADVDFVKEDGPLVADGNVLTGTGGNDANGTDGVADIQGADGASVTAISFGGTAGQVGQEIKGAYGTLLIHDDGRYVYTLDNGNGVVQGLDSTETLTEIFTYVITDGDNDSAQASLTITIEGSDDGVTINGLSGQGAELIVREDDLLDGSSPDTGELTQANSFTLTAPDGVATITVGGQTIFANGSFVSGVVISNAYGTLTIDSFTPTPGADGDVIGGTVNYSFVLNDNTLLHTGADGASLTNSFPVEVTDSDGSKANASLDVAVMDDAPQARDDAATQPAEDAAMLINVITGEGTTTGAAGADTLGADGVNLAVGGQLVLTSGPAQGTAVYQGNGVFLYTPSAGATGEDQFTYTITDGDGDSSTATVTIVLAGDSTPVVLDSDLTVSEAGLPNGTQAAGNSETASGEMTITTGGDTLAKVEVQGSSGWIDVTGATVGSPVVVQGAAGTLTVTSDGLGKYSYSYTLTANNPTHPDNNPSDGDGISGAADTLPGDSFAVRVTDSDGTMSPPASIDVTVQDDAPVISLTGVAPTLTVDESNLAANSSQSFAGLFTSAYGADGAGTISYALGVNAGSTGLVDTATGQAVVLSQSGGVVIGTAGVGGAEVFRVSVNASGTVTLDQSRPVVHPTGDPNEPVTLNAANLITLTATITDLDGDSQSAAVNIGQKLVFLDDGPTVTATLNATALAQLDETVPGSGGAPVLIVNNIGDDPDVSGGLLISSASSGMSVLAVGGSYGADGQGSLSYQLVVTNASSGLSVTDGSAINLVEENGLIVGRVASGSFAGKAAFAISIDSSGLVKVEQYLSLQHPDAASIDESLSMLAGRVGVNVTRVDADGDSVTTATPVDISGLISFRDDGPASAPTAGEERGAEQITVQNITGDFSTGQFAMKFGSDGASSSGFNITGPTIPGVYYTETDVFDPITHQFLRTELLAEVSATHTAGTADDLFRLTVNADGSYRFDLINAEQVSTETISFASLGAGGPGFRELADDPSTVGVDETGRVEFQSNGNGVNASTPGFGVSNQFTDPGEWFTMEFHNPGSVGDDLPHVNADLLDSLSITVQQVQQGPVDFTWTANRYNPDGTIADTQSGTFTVTSTGVVEIDPTIEFSELRIENVDTNGSVRFATDVQVTRLVLPTDQNLNFLVSGTDGDGDPMTPISIGVLVDAQSIPPIAFDLDGDGLEFVGLSAGVHHDYGAGLVNTAWVSSDDGLLARATGGGYDIVFADDAPGAASDLEGLRLAYDSNGDGVFDAKDAAFAEFGIWQDANSNGRVDAGEFRSLTDAKIAAIELTSDGASYQAAGGDVTVLGEASYIRADGTKGTIGDVMFATTSLNEPSKTTETSSSAFNQALIAASLVAVAGAVEAVEQEPAPVVAEEDAPLADTMLASAAPAEAETSLEDSQSTSIGSTEDQALQADDEPVADSSHGGDEPATDHATLADASDAPAPVEASADTAQPDLGDHQGLLAQSIDLPAFDGSAALLAVAQSATTTSVAEVVSEALGVIGAPDIDTLLAALPGDIAPALFNPIAAEPIDSGHMAFAASVFDAALAAHDAMAVAHG